MMSSTGFFSGLKNGGLATLTASIPGVHPSAPFRMIQLRVRSFAASTSRQMRYAKRSNDIHSNILNILCNYRN
jgi:hypothetical protein